MDKSYLFAVGIEIVGISVTSIGVGYELSYHEPIGYIMITSGSVIFAVGSLMFAKIYSQLKKNKK